MSPSHSNKKGKRYRYYVSQAITQGNKNQAGEIHKIPAAEIENLVTREFTAFLKSTDTLQEYIADFDVHKQKEILSKTQETELQPAFIRALLAKVVLHKQIVEIILCRSQLIKGLESIISGDTLWDKAKQDIEDSIIITVNIRISTTSRNGGVLIINSGENKEVNLNPFLVKIIAKCYYWNKLILDGTLQSALDICRMEKIVDYDYIKNALSLSILSPRIIEAIMNGTQPADWTIQKLLKVKTLDWQEQERLLHLA